MVKGNSFLKYWQKFLSFFLILLLSVSFAWAEETATITEQNTFTLEIADNLINLQAEQASFKEILNDLEKKTGIKVKIFERVEDKKVMLNINCMLIYNS